jgi:hypothetical protein
VTTRLNDAPPPSTTYGFEIDPCAVLGVTVTASLQEIREAYHQKAQKHHPDHGGDDWAFKIVARAYEILGTARVADRIVLDPASQPHHPQTATPRAAAAEKKTEWLRPGRRDEWAEPGRIVDVELFLLRLEMTDVMDLFLGHELNRNLSCCLNISWAPPGEGPAPPDSAEILRDLSKTFDSMPTKTRAVSSWSRLEGLRFTGWLSYPNANKTWEAFEVFQKLLNRRKIGVNQWTREMILPRGGPG